MEEGYPPLPEGMIWEPCDMYAGDINVICTLHTYRGRGGCVAWWSAKDNNACIKKDLKGLWITDKTPVESKQHGLQYISAYFMLGMGEEGENE